MIRKHLIALKYIIALVVIVLPLQESRAQWVATNSPTVSPVTCFTSIGSNLFAGTSGNGVFISTDNGANWTAVNTGLTQQRVSALASMGSNLFAGTSSGDFRSTDSGKSWSKGLIGKGILSIVVKGADLYIGTDEGGVAHSIDSGKQWIPLIPGLSNAAISALAVIGESLFAGTIGNTGGGSVYRSTDGGNNWTAVNTGLADVIVYRLLAHGTNLIAGTIGGGLFLSTNEGSNWSAINSGITEDTVISLASSGANLFTGIFHEGIFVSTNEGGSWTQKNEGSPVLTPPVWAFQVNGSDLLAGTVGSIGIWRRPISEMTGSSGVAMSHQAQSVSTSYPNPSCETTTISYTVTTAGMVSIEVFDALSKSVAVLVHQTMQPGSYEATMDTRTLPGGVYYYRLDADGVVETRKLLIVR